MFALFRTQLKFSVTFQQLMQGEPVMPRRLRAFGFTAALALLAFNCCFTRAQDAPSTTAKRDYSDRILTPKAPAAPRVNGPTIYGQRPGRPFLYTIPATGHRPTKFGLGRTPEGR